MEVAQLIPPPESDVFCLFYQMPGWSARERGPQLKNLPRRSAVWARIDLITQIALAAAFPESQEDGRQNKNRQRGKNSPIAAAPAKREKKLSGTIASWRRAAQPGMKFNYKAGRWKGKSLQERGWQPIWARS